MGINWDNIEKALTTARKSIVNRYRALVSPFTLGNLGFACLIVISAPIWLPRTAWQMGLLISNIIRTHYTKKKTE